MRPYILAETNWKAVKNLNCRLVVLPWGATEAHNYHLPYSTDNIEAECIAVESVKIAWEKGGQVMILPTLPFGVNTGQSDIPFDINLNPSTQLAILKDIIETLNRHGVHRLVILNSHGGNDFKQILRELGLMFPKMFLSEINWYKISEAKTIFEDLGEHAGEIETSLMLYLKPDWVLPLSEAGNGNHRQFRFRAIREKWAWAERKWTQVTSDTGIGNPSKASAQKGKQFFTLITEKIGQYLYELSVTENDDFYM